MNYLVRYRDLWTLILRRQDLCPSSSFYRYSMLAFLLYVVIFLVIILILVWPRRHYFSYTGWFLHAPRLYKHFILVIHVCIRIFSTIMFRVKREQKLAESCLLDITTPSKAFHQVASKFKPTESWLLFIELSAFESLVALSTLVSFHPRFTS